MIEVFAYIMILIGGMGFTSVLLDEIMSRDEPSPKMKRREKIDDVDDTWKNLYFEYVDEADVLCEQVVSE